MNDQATPSLASQSWSHRSKTNPRGGQQRAKGRPLPEGVSWASSDCSLVITTTHGVAESLHSFGRQCLVIMTSGCLLFSQAPVGAVSMHT